MANVLYTQPIDFVKQTEKKDLCFMFHGMLGTGTNLISVARMTQDLLYPIIFDIPNHGKSPHLVPGDFDHTESIVSDSIEKECREQGREHDEQIHLLGHSLGGKYAMLYALKNPQRVRSLVIMDIAPMNYPPYNLPYLLAYRKIVQQNIATRKEAVQILGENIDDQALVFFLAKNLYEADGRIQLHLNGEELIRQSSALCSFPASVEGKTYEGPVLVLRAETTDYFTEESESYIQRYFPNYHLELVPETSHIVHVDNPKKMQEFLFVFYKKVIKYT